jgi:Tol biopolymer transport system component
MADASPDAYVPSCWGQAFTAPQPVTALNSAAPDVYLRLSSDELTAYFARVGSAAPTMGYYATRASATSPFGTVMTLQMTNSTSTEVFSPTTTADGLTMLFASSRTGTLGGQDIWMATRSATTVNFGNITNVSAANSTGAEEDVYVVPDGSAIYFSSDRNSQIFSIFRAEKSGSTYTNPTVVLSDSNLFVSRVVVSADELTMFYQEGNDIHETHRDSKTAAFTLSASPVATINSVNADHPTWISNDGCRLYLETDRQGTQGLDFYLAVRTPQ